MYGSNIILNRSFEETIVIWKTKSYLKTSHINPIGLEGKDAIIIRGHEVEFFKRKFSRTHDVTYFSLLLKGHNFATVEKNMRGRDPEVGHLSRGWNLGGGLLVPVKSY